jgi:predicted transposase YbfD/YdcC
MSVSHAAEGLSNPAAFEGERNCVGLLEMLGRLADPRSPQGKIHELVFVLACAVVATLAGATCYRELGSQVADFDQSLLEKLGAGWNFFAGRFDAPSEATLRRVLQRIDAAALDRLVGAWLAERVRRQADGLLVIAVDGKVLRGSWTDANDKVTLFSAMVHAPAVTIAQVKVPDGTNEITQVKQLLDNIEGEHHARVVVTLDAAHTQHETAEYIAGERGFDYIMTVKGNQPTLQKELWDRCLPLLAGEPDHFVAERGHGRIKHWSTWTTNADGIDLPHATQIACIRRDVFDLDQIRISKEFALILTNAPADQTGPTDLHTHVRQHWGIENKSHYVRDTTWREDHHQAWTKNGPYSMAILRNLALGLFRLNGIHKIKEATERICWDRNRALPLLAT